MIPLIAGLGLAMAGSAGSTLLGHSLGQSSAKQQQRAQVDAYKNRHTWEVADLRNAGLNPILSAQGGGGSVGGMAQAPVPQSDAGRTIGDAVQGASARAVAKAQIKNLEADTALKTANSFESSQRAAVSGWQAHSAMERAKMDNMETQAMARDPDALWRTRYQGPLMRKIDDVSASAKQLYKNYVELTPAQKEQAKKLEQKMKGVPPPF